MDNPSCPVSDLVYGPLRLSVLLLGHYYLLSVYIRKGESYDVWSFLKQEENSLKILFVDSGAAGFHSRYAFDIQNTLISDFRYISKQVAPCNLSHQLISEFRPDVLMVIHGTRTTLEFVRYAKAHGAITVLWLVEDPYEIDFHRGAMVGAYDYVFTNEKEAVKEYNHPRVYYLPWCCNPRVHKRIAVTGNYQSDICFVGMGFANRIRTLNAVAPILKKYKVVLIGHWNRWGEELHPDLKGFVHPVIDNFLEVQKYYNGAKINLNLHRDPVDPPSGNRLGVGATSPNDRTFALAGCGVFQLVDQTRPDLWGCFQEESEIVGFSDPDDLGRKIQEYLPKPEIREAVGKSAQLTAYLKHTFRHRLSEIFHLIEKSLCQGGRSNTTICRSFYQSNRYSTYSQGNSKTWITTR
jgi:spore maturation protein CgeB